MTAHYHRYGSRVPVNGTEHSFYDGIDTSLVGIASLATGGDVAPLKKRLAQLADIAGQACDHYNVNTPAQIAPLLADGLKATRTLMRQVSQSQLAEPGKDDVLFELGVKEKQFETALTLALHLTFGASVAPPKQSGGSIGGVPRSANHLLHSYPWAVVWGQHPSLQPEPGYRYGKRNRCGGTGRQAVVHSF